LSSFYKLQNSFPIIKTRAGYWSPQARGFLISPDVCHGGTSKCGELRLIANKDGIKEAYNGTYECTAYKSKYDYRYQQNAVSRQRAEILVKPALCDIGESQIDNKSCSRNLRNGICCKAIDGTPYPKCFAGYSGNNCMDKDAPTGPSSNPCEDSAWQVAYVVPAAVASMVLALFAYCCVMYNQKKEAAREEKRVRKVSRQEQQTNQTLVKRYEGVVARSLEDGIDRVHHRSMEQVNQARKISTMSNPNSTPSIKRAGNLLTRSSDKWVSEEILNTTDNTNQSNNNTIPETAPESLSLNALNLLEDRINSDELSSNEEKQLSIQTLPLLSETSIDDALKGLEKINLKTKDNSNSGDALNRSDLEKISESTENGSGEPPIVMAVEPNSIV